MKKTVTEILLADTVFIAVLMISGLFSSPLSSAVYTLAFIIPSLMLLLLWQGRRREDFKFSVFPSVKGIGAGFLLSPILVSLLMAVSALSSFLIQLIGYEAPTTELEGNIFVVIFLHALCPAVLEELFFRYIPLRALGSYSKKWAIIYSAVFFSLAHCNIFQIPYALVAGLLLSVSVVLTGSIWPSVIAHFINNLVSVLWQRSEKGEVFLAVFFSALFLTLAISVAMLIIKRKRIWQGLGPIIRERERMPFIPYLAVYIIITVFLSFVQYLF